MKYMLDTCTCVMLIRKKSQSVFKRITSISPNEVCISSLCMAELTYGIQRSNQIQANQAALDQFLASFAIIPFDDGSAVVYGEIRAYLEARGTPIGSIDTLIAAQAVQRNLILVTHNTKEFSRVPALRIEDWVAP